MPKDQVPPESGGETPPPAKKKPLGKLKSRLLNAALLVAVAAAGYAATLYFNSGSPPPAPPPLETAGPVPAFSFTDLNGKPHQLKDFAGKTILINFWATWCAPCVTEFPALLQIAEKNPGKIVLIALSSDIAEDDIRAFLKKQRIPGRNVFIALDNDDITHKLFRIDRLPETIIADGALNERSRLVGAEWTIKDLQKIIDSLQP